MFRLLGVALLAGAGVGAYVSSVVKDKINGGGFKTASKHKTEVIRISPDDELVSAKIVVKERKKPEQEG